MTEQTVITFGDTKNKSALIMADIVDDIPCVYVMPCPDYVTEEDQLKAPELREMMQNEAVKLDFVTIQGAENLLIAVSSAIEAAVQRGINL